MKTSVPITSIGEPPPPWWNSESLATTIEKSQDSASIILAVHFVVVVVVCVSACVWLYCLYIYLRWSNDIIIIFRWNGRLHLVTTLWRIKSQAPPVHLTIHSQRKQVSTQYSIVYNNTVLSGVGLKIKWLITIIYSLIKSCSKVVPFSFWTYRASSALFKILISLIPSQTHLYCILSSSNYCELLPCLETGQETRIQNEEVDKPRKEQGVPVVKRRHARPLELDSEEDEEQEEEEKEENSGIVEELGSEQEDSKKPKNSNSEQV